MNSVMPFADEVFTVRAPMGQRKILLRTPERLAAHPSLLITLGGPCQRMIDDADYRTVSDIFLAAGHRVASFDLPNHGERVDEHGEGLPGMAKAIESGSDVFGDIRDTGRALIDHAVTQGWTRADEVMLLGVSRGGLSAMHIMAGDERVGAAAVLAPVTHLPALNAFAHLEGNPIIAQSNADALVDRLADRWLLVSNGETDPVVDERACFAFYSRLVANSTSRLPELYTAPGQSHGTTYVEHIAYQVAASFLLTKLAACGKMSSKRT